MFKGVKYVVKTTSEKERVELRDFIFQGKKAVSLIYDGDGEQLIAILTGEAWMLCSTSEDRIKSYQYDYFASANEFIEFCKKNRI